MYVRLQIKCYYRCFSIAASNFINICLFINDVLKDAVNGDGCILDFIDEPDFCIDRTNSAGLSYLQYLLITLNECKAINTKELNERVSKRVLGYFDLNKKDIPIKLRMAMREVYLYKSLMKHQDTNIGAGKQVTLVSRDNHLHTHKSIEDKLREKVVKVEAVKTSSGVKADLVINTLSNESPTGYILMILLLYIINLKYLLTKLNQTIQ